MYTCKKIFTFLTECLFPIFCLACNKEGEVWCDECRKKFSFYIPSISSVDINPLSGLTALFRYNENEPPAQMIKALKYAGGFSARGIWEKVFYDYFSSHPVVWLQKRQPINLVPVPLHPRRERERGFNQSHILAEQLEKSLRKLGYTVTVSACLKRIRNTPHQASLDGAKRLTNVQNAFALKFDPPSGHIVLVDDVFTTGSTMGECGRVLVSHGREVVFGCVVARG